MLELVNVLNVVLDVFFALIGLVVHHDGLDVGHQVLVYHHAVVLFGLLFVFHLHLHLPNGLSISGVEVIILVVSQGIEVFKVLKEIILFKCLEARTLLAHANVLWLFIQ